MKCRLLLFVVGVFHCLITLQAQEPLIQHASTLIKNPLFDVQRLHRSLIVTLKTPHTVLTSSAVNGGQSDTLKYLVNFQSMEAKGHNKRLQEIVAMSDKDYHLQVASSLSIDPNRMALMGTAANVYHTSHVQKSFRDLTINVLATAGVRGNALRAGDKASWYQGDQGSVFVKDKGTINIIVLLNRSLSDGALAKAAMVMTEAKSAALAELAISSTQSSHPATGTGTDQFIMASPIDSKKPILNSASGHLKLGELIGTSVKEAVLEALRVQNGLNQSSIRSVTHALGRHGLDRKKMLAQLKEQLSDDDYNFLEKNQQSVFTAPRLVAAAYAYAALLDRIQYGTFSTLVAHDILLDQAAIAAVAVSNNDVLLSDFRQQLSSKEETLQRNFVLAIAMGWQAKWSQ